ncbi:MAG: tetratricopeptide repeat protein [Planctomycetes bacterium]|nr:tetratricopeptide repeat protein [Planctomycetota bacterium]
MPPTTVDVAALLESQKPSAADLAAARNAVRDVREARAAAEKAAADTGSAVRRGMGLYLLGRARAAVATLRGAGDGAAVRAVRGLASLEDGDPAGAAADLATVAGAETALATARALVGDGDGARAAAGKLGADRKADALYAEGMALEADGRHLDARAKLEAAVAADPAHARALFHLAHMHDLAGDDEKAIDLYRRCAAVEPTYVNALLNLGVLLEDHDRFTEAEALYRRVLAADPTHERARLYLRDVVAAQTMYFDEESERKEDRRAQVLRTPISEFELSVRSRNCLAKMEIKTLGDLVRKSEAELLAYKNFGETSLQEIKDILAQKGLRLGMAAEEVPAASREDAEAELDALFGGADDDADDDEDLAEGGDPRSLPVSALRMSVRTQKCIEELELETVGDLADRTEAELMASKNMGKTTLDEVRKKLAGLGLALKGETAPAAEPADEDEGDDAEDEDDGD